MFVHVFGGCLKACEVQQDLKTYEHISNIEIMSTSSTHPEKKIASPK